MIHPITSSLEVFERVASAKLVPWNKAITRSQTVKITYLQFVLDKRPVFQKLTYLLKILKYNYALV